MEYNQFMQLLQLKGVREKETVALLEEFIEKFPYCQSSRLLLAKSLHDQDNIHFDRNLKVAAAYAPDREVLRELIEMKTEKVEFEFPPSRKAEPERADHLPEKETFAESSAQKEQPFEEWYSEDEISGRAFEEQKEKEKIVDPHEIIRRRLSEILSDGSVEVESKTESPAAVITKGDKKKEEINVAVGQQELAKEKPAEKIVPEEIKIEPSFHKPDTEEFVYKEDLVAEQKLEEEMINPVPENSKEEKAIMAQAEKARDVLDKMELEHAMEESILDSLEKLPVIVPPSSAPGKKISPSVPVEENKYGSDSSRTFTEWLKSLSGKSAGFEEVRAPKIKEDILLDEQSPIAEDPDSHLSDDELIEKFLLEDPKIVPSKAEFYSPLNQAKKSVMDRDDVVSETLAQIYLRQGNTQKARWCYEKLILLHPEKSAFFAALLAEIPEGE